MGPRQPAVKDRIRHIEAEIRSEFAHLAFAGSEFPMLTRWGVPDFSQTIHSLGCNYLAALGRHLNCLACTEYPIRLPGNQESRSVRADIAWWDRETEYPLLIGEFERCEPGKAGPGLAAKARNLLYAHRVLPPGPRVLLLMGWKQTGTPTGDLTAVKGPVCDGFCPPGGMPLRGLGPDSRFILVIADMGIDSENTMKLAKARIL